MFGIAKTYAIQTNTENSTAHADRLGLPSSHADYADLTDPTWEGHYVLVHHDENDAIMILRNQSCPYTVQDLCDYLAPLIVLQ